MNPRSRESEEIRPNNYYVYVILHKAKEIVYLIIFIIVPMLHQMLKNPKSVVLVIQY